MENKINLFLKELWNSPKSLNFLSIIFCAFSIIFFSSNAFTWFFSKQIFLVKAIELDIKSKGNTNIEYEEIKNMILGSLNGTTLTTNLDNTSELLNSHPWINSYLVRRVWPNKILVSIKEHNIIATWNESLFISDEGKIIDLPRAEKKTMEKNSSCFLLNLYGPVGSVKTVLDRAKIVNKALNKIDLNLQSLELSERYDWKAKTADNLIIKLGGDQLISPATDRLNNLSVSFFWLKEKLKNNSNKYLSLIDLRYAQGFAFKTYKTPKLNEKNKKYDKNCLSMVKLGIVNI